jgi:methylated-DNA-protein-cysteine methyltransferase-like protein
MGNRPTDFTRRVEDLIRAIPRGKVASYGQIAALAGDARHARQVAWILHSSSEKEALPWHRVIGSRGKISLPPSRGGREQKRLLAEEGVRFGRAGTVDWNQFGWKRRLFRSLEKLDLDAL